LSVLEEAGTSPRLALPADLTHTEDLSAEVDQDQNHCEEPCKDLAVLAEADMNPLWEAEQTLAVGHKNQAPSQKELTLSVDPEGCTQVVDLERWKLGLDLEGCKQGRKGRSLAGS